MISADAKPGGNGSLVNVLAKTLSLQKKKTEQKQKQKTAHSALCSMVSSITAETVFITITEALQTFNIPLTDSKKTSYQI